MRCCEVTLVNLAAILGTVHRDSDPEIGKSIAAACTDHPFFCRRCERNYEEIAEVLQRYVYVIDTTRQLTEIYLEILSRVTLENAP
jgi:hypothetical protein